jgi:hypothetical protein
MNEKEKLKVLYENRLKPELDDIEKERKTIKRIYTAAIALAICAFLFFSIFWVIAVVFVIGAIIFAGFGATKYLHYRNMYKEKVVRKIIELINPEYHYASDNCISSERFIGSKIFKQSYDRYRGDDFVAGTIEKTDFEFSELKAEYKTETTDDDGKKQTQWNTIFQGVFFHANFNKYIVGETFVLPDKAEKRFGKFAQKFQKDHKRGELVKLENPEFEKAYKVYSSSQQEARYILTPTMMEAMAAMQKRFNRPMHFSFIGERVCCAVSFNKGLFEPRITSGTKFSDVEEMYSLFSLIEIIIHEMNLNTRIWTKN